MKKRLLSLLLALIFVFTLLPAFAAAADITGNINASATWNDSDVVTGAVTITGGTEDSPLVITVNGTVTVKAQITVFSGYVEFTGGGTLKRGSSYTGILLLVGSSSTGGITASPVVTLRDVTIDGYGSNVEASSEAILVKNESSDYTATLNFTSGAVLQNCKRNNQGAGLYIAKGGVVNMTGGAIKNNTSEASGTANLYGCGVRIDDTGAFTMTGGSITGNTAENTLGGYTGSGGGVCVYGGKSVFTMKGGSISGNTVDGNGGGVYIEDGTFKVSGSAVVTDNVVGGTITDGVLSGGTANNVYLRGSKTITVTGALTGSIGVTPASFPTTASGTVDIATGDGTYTPLAADATHFFSDKAYGGTSGSYVTYSTALSSPNVQITATAATNIKIVDGTSSDGHYETLAGAITDLNTGSSGANDGWIIDVQADQTITSSTEVSAITKSCTILSTNGKGIKRDSSYTGILLVVGSSNYTDTNPVVTLRDVTIDGNNVEASSEAILVKNEGNSATLNFGSGTVLKNCKRVGDGAGIYIADGGTVNMTGGSITGNTSTIGNGGGVYVAPNSSFKVGGTAVVSGNTAGATDSKINNNVYLPTGKTITVADALTSGASIGVTTADTPAVGSSVNVTTGNNNADYSTYFHSDNASYLVWNSVTGEAQIVKLSLPVAEVKVGSTTTTPYATHEAAWNAAVTATPGSGETVTVKLLADWTAGNTTAHSFGTGAGFGSTGDSTTNTGNILVPSDKTITLDLNGKTINRGLTGATEYGNVIRVSGELTLTDTSTAAATDPGKITGGSAAQHGGGVYVAGTLTMTGGSVTGNTAASNGGGVYVEGSFKVGGTAVVSGNTATESTTASNVYLPNNKTITCLDTLTIGASIGVTTQTTPTATAAVAITGENGADYSGFFNSDNDEYGVKNIVVTSNNTLYLAAYEAKPEIAIDYANEQLTGFDTGNYTIGGTVVSPSDGKLAINSDWFGKTLSIVKRGGDNTIDSEAQSLEVPAIPAKPTVSAENATTYDDNDGKITGVTSAMEYRKDGGAWSDVEATEITGLSHGNYDVRIKAVTEGDNKGFASPAATVTIASPKYPLTVTAPTFADVTYGYDQPDANTLILTNTVSGTICSVKNISLTGINKNSFEVTSPESGTPVDVGDTPNTSFTVRPKENLAFGTYKATVTVEYTTTGVTTTPIYAMCPVSITVNKVDISDASVDTFDAMTYTGEPQTPEAKVTKNGLEATGTWSDVTNVTDTTTFTANGNFTGTITARYPGMKRKVVDAFDLTSLVTAPVRGDTPQTEFANQTQYTGTISWEPNDATFKGSTVYTATLTLTATSNYTFTGVAVNSFTHGGATSVTNAAGSGTVTIVFPETKAIIIDDDPVTPPTATVPTYPPTVPASEGGGLSITPTDPRSGETVVITVKPDEGMVLDAITATDANGNTVPLTKNADCTYSFTQPAGKVTLKATFKSITEPVIPTTDFTDVKDGDWFKSDVDYVVAKGLMEGTSATDFSPYVEADRGMIVTILWRLEGKPVVNFAMSYPDVGAEEYYTEAVRWAASQGIVGGYDNGGFGPGDSVTREQLVTMLYRYAKLKGDDVTAGGMGMAGYEDVGSISDWAYDAMQWAVLGGLVNGSDGSLMPQGSATRAELAAMLHRFCESTVK